MIPPLDEAVLQDNPDFAILYSKLTKAVLNPDGSTKDDPAAKERRAVHQKLEKHRLKTARHHLITHAIATATATAPGSRPPAAKPSGSGRPQTEAPGLPDPLLDLLVILPPLLSRGPSLPPGSISLLFSSPPLSQLEALLPDLAAAVSSHLRDSALGVARVAHPSTNPSYLHRRIASLPQDASALASGVAQAQQSLAAARLAALAALTSLLRAHAQCLAHLVRSLEAKHGAAARSLELRASDVSLRARRTGAEAGQALGALRREVYSPEAVAALRNYTAHLKDARVRGSERVRGLLAELGEYGVGVEGGEAKEKTMREMARVHREMTRQMGDVKGDLQRLRDR